MIVVDASVAVKWLIAEPNDKHALAILGGFEPLVAPDLILLEVASAISRRTRDQRLAEHVATELYGKWKRILDEDELSIRSLADVIDRAFRISTSIAHPVADCVYIACAEAFGASLLTADVALFDRGRKAYPQISFLGKAA
jgi:predicted nucleic acid-binding protein